ncbi:hypothetical protein [Microvirga yunnanensis]|uniref:hypothetical protein n=1 Tax=Microvirga yunnanensis TaxID=2953740 RepID=UPI0021CA27CC|nr:hypothetical protein [Microvirga sp. HBU65207]
MLNSYNGSLMREGANFPDTTRLILKDSDVHEVVVSRVKGSPENPHSSSEMEIKFCDCCHWLGKEKGFERVAEIAHTLADTASVRESLALFEAAMTASRELISSNDL